MQKPKVLRTGPAVLQKDISLGGGTSLFIGLPNTTSLEENQPAGIVVYTFSVTSTSLLVTPRIINSNPLTRAFRIDEQPPNYLVVTTGSPVLDFETTPSSFDIQIYMEDDKMATELQTLTVQLTNINEPPVFLDNLANQVVTIYIEEGTPNGVIYTTLVSDPEDAISALKFSLIPSSAPFTISPTGVIQSTKIFDYETDPQSYSLILKVTDSGGLSVNGSLEVRITNINDETPYFTMTTTTFTIPEEQNPGYPVGTITAKDPDDAGFISTLYYSINTPNQYFSINQLTGVIQVAKRIDIDVATLGISSTIALEIKVSDLPSAGHSNLTTITIKIQDLNDNPPTCIQYAFSFAVPETEVNGALITDLSPFCSDIDVDPINKALNFTGLSGLGSNERFRVIPAGSGRIVLTGDLNFEDLSNIGVGNEYSLEIEVEDIAPPNYKKKLYVYVKTLPVNEFSPVFNSSSYVFNVSELSPSNINNHFAFSPSSGSNVSSLILAIPFDYSKGGDTTWKYNMRVLITDDNLISSKSSILVQTGTVSLTINVYIPGLTTTTTTTTPGAVYVTTSKNVYSPLAWYIPLVCTIGALLLLGLLGLLIYLLAKYCPCKGRTKPDTDPLIKPAEKKVKQDVVWEMTKLNTVFDGEAVDPITGSVYEYNSKSGARRWKDPNQPVVPVPVPQQLPVNPAEQTSLPVLTNGTPNKKVKTPSGGAKAEDVTNTAVPGTPNRLQSPSQTATNIEPEKKSPSSRSPLSPRRSPKVSPKIPKTPS
ncbi:cadherin-related family member 3 isoform X4 [Dendrobates tinctorius]|uniref:cadherin-related family member 3 isoform X4 n=1 Tax=Dendrobates tinctorius TaxID=92724 RepID=UPI003CCA4CC9